MAPMAATSHRLLTPPGSTSGVVEDHDQHAEDEQADDQEPHPAGAGLGVLRDRAACSGCSATGPVARGRRSPAPPDGPALLLRLARALPWPWLPWPKDSQSRPVADGPAIPARPGRYDQWPMGTRVLVIDNYDSFVYNLVQELGELGAEPVVHRNDAIDVDGIRAASPDAILISPGPGRPEDAGISLAVIERAGRRDPHPRGVPRPPGHRPGLRRRGGAGPHPHARQDLGHPPRRRRASSPGCPTPSSPPATTRWWSSRPRCPTSWRSRATDRRRGDHGPPPPDAAGRRRAVPPRVVAHPGRARACCPTSWPPPARHLSRGSARRPAADIGRPVGPGRASTVVVDDDGGRAGGRRWSVVVVVVVVVVVGGGPGRHRDAHRAARGHRWPRRPGWTRSPRPAAYWVDDSAGHATDA